MGLFSSKTKVYVSSSVWNMAGDYEERAELLPSLITSAVLTRTKASLSDLIQKNLRSSTALKTRTFFRWASQNYDLGVPSGSVGIQINVNKAGIGTALKTILGLNANQKIRLISAFIDDADLEYWVEDWVRINRPTLSEADWTGDYDPATEEFLIDIGGTVTRIPAAAHFKWGIVRNDRKILYAVYQVLTKNARGKWVEGAQTLFTYRMGTGNSTFDALTGSKNSITEFSPAIPLRLDNVSIRDGTSATYDSATEAFKKLTGGKIDEVLDEIEDHEDIDDMDNVLVVPAISLNTEDKRGQAYIYAFLKSLIPLQRANFDFESFFAARLSSAQSKAQWDRWGRRNIEGSDGSSSSSSTVDEPDENGVFWDRLSDNEIQIRMEDLTQFDFRISWKGIKEEQFVGNGARFNNSTSRTLMKKGAYAIHKLEPLRPNQFMGEETSFIRRVGVLSQPVERFVLIHQYELRRYRMLTVSGLAHANYVYGNKAVRIGSDEALDDSEESGFLFPLHRPTLLSMSLADSAQLSTCSTYLVVNAYKKVKQKWWQRGIFKIILAAVAIAISIFSAGAGLGATAGLLGTNAAVGTMLGATAATAAMVGAIANGIAAVVLSSLLSRASVALFGEKWGAIIGTIASFIGMQVGMTFAQTGSFNMNWSQLLRVDNILRLTSSVSGAYAQFLAADTADIYAQIQEMGEEYKDKIDEIKDYASEILGMTNVEFDPMMLTDASEYFGESSEAFLSRTLLTGSDIAEISTSLVDSFVELSLELPRAL